MQYYLRSSKEIFVEPGSPSLHGFLIMTQFNLEALLSVIAKEHDYKATLIT